MCSSWPSSSWLPMSLPWTNCTELQPKLRQPLLPRGSWWAPKILLEAKTAIFRRGSTSVKKPQDYGASAKQENHLTQGCIPALLLVHTLWLLSLLSSPLLNSLCSREESWRTYRSQRCKYLSVLSNWGTALYGHGGYHYRDTVRWKFRSKLHSYAGATLLNWWAISLVPMQCFAFLFQF